MPVCCCCIFFPRISARVSIISSRAHTSDKSKWKERPKSKVNKTANSYRYSMEGGKFFFCIRFIRNFLEIKFDICVHVNSSSSSSLSSQVAHKPYNHKNRKWKPWMMKRENNIIVSDASELMWIVNWSVTKYSSQVKSQN